MFSIRQAVRLKKHVNGKKYYLEKTKLSNENTDMAVIPQCLFEHINAYVMLEV